MATIKRIPWFWKDFGRDSLACSTSCGTYSVEVAKPPLTKKLIDEAWVDIMANMAEANTKPMWRCNFNGDWTPTLYDKHAIKEQPKKEVELCLCSEEIWK